MQYSCLIFINCHLKRRFRDIQIVIITIFVVLTSFGVTRVDGTLILDFEQIHCCRRDVRFKHPNQMADNLDPDETASDEPSHLVLHSLQKCGFWSAGLKELSKLNTLVSIL